jgi:hypothetical protein
MFVHRVFSNARLSFAATATAQANPRRTAITFAKFSFAVSLALALGLTVTACGPERNPASPNSQPANPEQTKIDALAPHEKAYFDAYILKAVSFLYLKYKMLGYDMNQLYTHDLPYGHFGMITGTPGPKTMCVAAQEEVILTAMDIYERETGDKSVHDFLPIQSWKGLTQNDIKGHIWVNARFNSFGTADALKQFGMGENTTFENLRPGAFINFSRTTKSGHAVTFISFIDKDGKEYDTYNAGVIGFKYFSAQGVKDPATAGFDFRYAVFSKFGCPEMPYKNDCNIIYSQNRSTFDAGRMWAPSNWKHPVTLTLTGEHGEPLPDTVLDTDFYTGE